MSMADMIAHLPEGTGACGPFTLIQNMPEGCFFTFPTLAREYRPGLAAEGLRDALRAGLVSPHGVGYRRNAPREARG